jgi:hypothetical protein
MEGRWQTLRRRPVVLAGAALLVTFAVSAGLTSLIDSDLDHQSRLMNVSCRGPAGTGPECLLAAFVISDRPQTVVVRARGWAPARATAPEVPRDVLLRVVRNADGVDVGRNERWRAPGNERLWGDLKYFAPGDERHSACVLTLPPGGYSALVEDRAAQPGLAFIEIFVAQR